MKLLLKYKDTIVSMGLLPTLCTFIGLHWLPAAPVLLVGLLSSVGGLVYALGVRRSLNFFLLQGLISMTLCYAVYGSGTGLLSEADLTLALEFLLLAFAFLYLTLPDSYQTWLAKMHLIHHISYQLEARIIVILSAAHLFSMFVVYASDLPPVPQVDYLFRHVIPIGIYLLCMIINIIGIRLALQAEELPSSLIRIAPLYQGKIYLSDHASSVWDLPFTDSLLGPSSAIDRKARKLVRKNITSPHTSPRLLLRHWTDENDLSHRRPVSVYIYPLRHADELRTEQGRFFSFEEIKQQPAAFSPSLLKELEHLQLAAEVWNEYEKS